jgi:DNA-binding GntR family transcriptional regulator
MGVFHQPIYEKIKNALREQIISEQIEPGSRITIQEIAEKYGVSQMPVREALQWLQGEGLLKIIPHKGAKVNHINAQLIKNHYEIRGAIALLLAKKSMDRISDNEILELERKHEEYMKATAEKDINLILQRDRDFHLFIYNHAENADAVDIYDKYSELLGALRKKYGLGEDRRKEKVEQHGEIIQALKQKNVSLLEEIITNHNENAKQDLLMQMSLKVQNKVLVH